ncbi:MAG: hypothetical protein ACM3XO_24250 [Bacteroidota bacterium]
MTGWDCVWLILAVICDVMHYGSTAYQNKDQIPGISTAITIPCPFKRLYQGEMRVVYDGLIAQTPRSILNKVNL